MKVTYSLKEFSAVNKALAAKVGKTYSTVNVECKSFAVDTPCVMTYSAYIDGYQTYWTSQVSINDVIQKIKIALFADALTSMNVDADVNIDT